MTTWTRISVGGPKVAAKIKIELRPFIDGSEHKVTSVRINFDSHETTLLVYEHQHTFEDLVEMFPAAELIGVPPTA